MTRRLLTLLLFAGALPRVGWAGDLCTELAPTKHKGAWAVAPLTCGDGLQAACATVTNEVLGCLSRNGIKAISPEGIRAAVDEKALKQAMGNGSSSDLQELGASLGAKFMVVGQVSTLGVQALGLVRVISVEDGKVLEAARIALDQKGRVASMGDVAPETIENGLRQLADKLASGFATLPGNARYKKLAVLTFKETGDLAQKKALGTLVGAELMTRFRRDHGLVVVERSRLEAVLKELELGQTGLVDEKHAPKLGKLLEADALVLGSVAEQGEKFAVHAQIVDVVTGVTLLADNVQLKAEGLIALSSDAVVLRSKGGSVFRSVLIPGWGQFYNRQNQKAYTFIGVLAGLAAGAVTTHILSAAAYNEYLKETRPGANFDALISRSENLLLTRNIILGVLAAAWAYNVLDAYLNGATFDSAITTSTSTNAASASGVQLTPAGLFGRF